MDNNQLSLLHDLRKNLNYLFDEANSNQDFNELLAAMDIFKVSIEEAFSRVDAVIDSIHELSE